MEVVASINGLLEHNIFITEDSLNTIQEFRNYQWDPKKVDKHNHPKPIDLYNHSIDSIRYGYIMHFKPRGKSKIKVKTIW